MNKVQLHLDKIEADFLRSEFKAETEVQVSARNEMGKYLISLVKKSHKPVSLPEAKNKALVTLLIPDIDGLNLNKYFLYYSKESQKMINYYVRSIMYAKAMLWITQSIIEGRTAQFGLLQFIHRHKMRNNEQNLEHLKKMTYRHEVYSFQRSLESVEDAVKQHYDKFI